VSSQKEEGEATMKEASSLPLGGFDPQFYTPLGGMVCAAIEGLMRSDDPSTIGTGGGLKASDLALSVSDGSSVRAGREYVRAFEGSRPSADSETKTARRIDSLAFSAAPSRKDVSKGQGDVASCEPSPMEQRCARAHLGCAGASESRPALRQHLA